MFELMVEDTFDSAHALRGYQGSCENLHGHTWRVQVFLSGEKLNDIGILHDFLDIRAQLRGIIDKYDHTNLNDLPEFQKINPSSENIAKNIYETLKGGIRQINKVTVWESAGTKASYYE